MKLFPTLLLAASLTGCQPRQDDTSERSAGPAASIVPRPAATTDSVPTPARLASAQLLALTANALQLVSQPNGSTTEIPFGMPLEQLVEIVNKVLQVPVTSMGINSECGAGPLKMATWSNGLTLAFQQKKRKGATTQPDWQFVGWYLGAPSGKGPKLTSMAGIGIGSTRAELDMAYAITLTTTSLGSEFSTTSGLYGILAGPDKGAKITRLWSGTNCIFR